MPGGIFSTLRAPLLLGVMVLLMLFGGGLSLVLSDDGSSLTRLTSVTTIPPTEPSDAVALLQVRPDTNGLVGSSSVERVVPVVECVDRRDPSTWLAYFGYENGNDSGVSVPVGDTNHLRAATGTPPTRFDPGRLRYAFAVALSPDETVNWSLQGRTASAGGIGPECDLGVYEDIALPAPGA
jgi:hypothetical protein